MPRDAADIEEHAPRDLLKGTLGLTMALDELHARRLSTVITVFEKALDRVELVFQAVEGGSSQPGVTTPGSLSPRQTRRLHEVVQGIRQRLEYAVNRFSLQLQKPEPKQVLAAELSSLWVVLENAMPKRMKGYGKEFDPTDKGDWEDLIRSLLDDVERARKIVLDVDPQAGPQKGSFVR